MKARDIDRFFKELDRRVDVPLQIILTGGAAGILQGVDRATQDIDFELHLKKNAQKPSEIENVQKAILETGRVTGIAPQYAEDIDRWSSILLPNKKSQRYLRIGKVEVRILEPGLWAIGKLSRYLSSDVSDLRAVLKTKTKDPRACARLWGRALGLSPASNQQGLFRRQVESFFDHYARDIWGQNTDPEELKRVFLYSARMAKKK
jgi:hypothetical protein